MDDNQSLFNLTSFLFGNVDETGCLEDDILDDDCKRHVNSLGKLGLQPLLTEIIGEDIIKSEKNDAECGSPVGFDVKSPSAKDYFDENELASESTADEVAKNELDQLNGVLDENTPSFPKLSVSISRVSENVGGGAENRKRKLETPLAAMLPEKYAHVDVREFFPDFRFGKVSIMIFIRFYLIDFYDKF